MDSTAEDGVAHSTLPTRGGNAAAAGHGHAAVAYDDPDALLATTTPFLEAGLRAGELVVLACPPDVADLVTAPLGERARGIEHDPRICLIGTRAPDGFVATRTLLKRAAAERSGRVRLLGQVQFGATPELMREGLRYEIAANAVLAGAPLSVLCLVDTAALPERLVRLVLDAHPQIATGQGVTDNHRYREPGSYLHALPVPRAPVEDAPPVLAVDGATGLAQLRGSLRAALHEVLGDPEALEDLLLAVAEVAANAFRHGRPPVAARLWSDGRRLVCEITDSGRGYDDPLAGFQPAHGEDLTRGGMGLWLARKLWDSVDLRNDERGLTVRLSTMLP